MAEFKTNRNNEAFLDRICVVKVPYCLRVDRRDEDLQKLLPQAICAQAPCAPGTLEMLASFSVLTRMKRTRIPSLHSKMRVYDGESSRTPTRRRRRSRSIATPQASTKA